MAEVAVAQTALRGLGPQLETRDGGCESEASFLPRALGVGSHLSVALPVNVDGRRRHDGCVFHVPGMWAALKNSVIVPGGKKERREW